MKIKNIKSTKTLDSRGEETIKVTLETNKGVASACVPQGKSKGKFEAVSLPVDKAIENINKKILPEIKNKKIKNQEHLDKILVDLDKSKNKTNLGANAVLGISLAFARVFSRSKNQKLYQYISELLGRKTEKLNNPWLLFNMINGGKHAPYGPGIQEYLVLLKFKNGEGIWKATEIYHKLGKKLKTGTGDEGGFLIKEQDNERPLQVISEVINELGMTHQVRLGVDVAASQLNENLNILPLMKKYNLFYIEDPLKEEDWKGFKNLKQNTKGTDWLIIGDDLTVSNPGRIKQAVEKQVIDGVIIKPNQIGTLFETIKSIKIAQESNLKVIISHRSGETCDPFISDLAIGVGAWGFKAGAPNSGERVAKYNRLLELRGN